MIRTILYSVLIMLFLGFLLVFGLLGPQQGRLAVERIYEFFDWKPAKGRDSLLTDTEVSIKQFNESYAKVQVLRQMTLERSEKAFKELEQVYTDTRENLKQLLLGMDQLTVEERTELFDKFTAMHKHRAGLVEQIMLDQQIMININEQMDQQLQAMSKWLNDKAVQLQDPSTKDLMRMQQYQNLKKSLTAFNEQSSTLDSMRILFMKKNKETIERLAETNRELENRFRELLAQVEISTSDQSHSLWDEYQRLETEQRDLVGSLRATEEFIGNNQNKLVSGVIHISKSIEYRSDTQLQRFRDSYNLLEQRRRQMLTSMNERQQIFISSQPTRKQLMEDNRYRMELMREQARQISDQYEQMEEFRKSAASMIRNVSAENRDKIEFSSQQTQDVMQRSRDKIESFMVQMEAAQRNVQQFIENSRQTAMASNSAILKMNDLQNKSKGLLDNMKKNEEQLRSIRVQVQRDQNAMNQMKRDTNRSNAERMRSVQERTDDQMRVMSDRIKDQMQIIKDKQQSQKSNFK